MQVAVNPLVRDS